MKPTTIKTTERIFQVETHEGETYLCNLEHIEFHERQLVVNNEYIKRIKHYWNYKFEPIGKITVKEMLELNQ